MADSVPSLAPANVPPIRGHRAYISCNQGGCWLWCEDCRETLDQGDSDEAMKRMEAAIATHEAQTRAAAEQAMADQLVRAGWSVQKPEAADRG